MLAVTNATILVAKEAAAKPTKAPKPKPQTLNPEP